MFPTDLVTENSCDILEQLLNIKINRSLSRLINLINMQFQVRKGMPLRQVVRARTENSPARPGQTRQRVNSRSTSKPKAILDTTTIKARKLLEQLEPPPSKKVSISYEEKEDQELSKLFQPSRFRKRLPPNVRGPLNTLKKVEPNLHSKSFQAVVQHGQSESKYLSYEAYARISEKRGLGPAYFENLAERNDSKHQQVNSMSRTAYEQDGFLRESKNRTDLGRMQLKQPKRVQTSPGKERYDTLNTESRELMIISSPLGALAASALQQQMAQQAVAEEQRRQISLGEGEGDDNDSELSSPVVLSRQSSLLRSALDSVSDQEKPWMQLPDKRIRDKLNRILESKAGNGQKQQDYSQLENNLLNQPALYKKRVYLMKHKLPWKG